jgi:hypothetical protein
MLALESEHDPSISRPYPFDVLGAQTQGMIGYWLVQALQNALPGRQVACLVSRTLVSRDDPAFANPSKFVGPVYDERQARVLAASMNWEVRQDGTRWRRVVPSPEPVGLLDLTAVRILLDRGAIEVCSGGGGVPVVAGNGTGPMRGVEAVVDKDLTASLLAVSWTPTRCCCSPTWRRSKTGTGPRRPGPSAGPRPQSSAPAPSRPDQWARRSRLSAVSSRRPGSPPPSASSAMHRRCSPARPGRSSPHHDRSSSIDRSKWFDVLSCGGHGGQRGQPSQAAAPERAGCSPPWSRSPPPSPSCWAAPAASTPCAVTTTHSHSSTAPGRPPSARSSARR